MPQVVPEEKKRKRDKFESESEADEFHPGVKVEVEQQADRPIRTCRTQQGATITITKGLYSDRATRVIICKSRPRGGRQSTLSVDFVLREAASLSFLTCSKKQKNV